MKSSLFERESYLQVLAHLGLNDELFIRHVHAHTYSCIRQNCQEMGSNQEVLPGRISLGMLGGEGKQGIGEELAVQSYLQKVTLPESFPSQLLFLVSVEPVFKTFLCFFQNEGPLIHLLCDAMCEMLKPKP